MEPAAALRIIKMSKTEWHYLFVGTFGAAINGSFPFVFAFLLGEIFGVSSTIDNFCGNFSCSAKQHAQSSHFKFSIACIYTVGMYIMFIMISSILLSNNN